MEYHQEHELQQLIEEIETHLSRKDYIRATDGVVKLQKLARNRYDHTAEAAACVYSGMLEFAAGNIENSIALREKALAIGSAHDTPYYNLRAYNGLGSAYSEQGDYYAALGNFINAYHIATGHPEFQYEAVILNNIGYLFVWLDEYETAAGYFTNAYDNYLDRGCTDRSLLVSIVRNLVEAWSCAGDYGEAKRWSANVNVDLTPGEKLTLSCMLLSNDAQMHYEEGDFDEAAAACRAFLDRAAGTTEFMYMFRSYLNVSRVAINLEDYELATESMQCLVELDKRAEIDTFRFRFAELRVFYYRKFLKAKDGGKYCDDFYEYYYFHSLRTISQLKQGYLNNLLVELEIDKSQFADNSVLRKSFQLKGDQELDPLTGLLNRVSAERYGAEKLAARRDGERQCMLLVRVDNFKALNDAYGHHFGDMLLLEVTDILADLGRGNAILGRYGGGEFSIFVSHAREQERIHERVTALLERAAKIALPDEVNGKVTFSVGSFFIEAPIGYEEAMSHVLEALDSVKGENRYAVYGK